ncbi:hypothetical protein F0726_02215 [Acidithiobacillus caldus]|nr:hypothetical protein F0726_02215 [Acidithiobacillus caldus]
MGTRHLGQVLYSHARLLAQPHHHLPQYVAPIHRQFTHIYPLHDPQYSKLLSDI